MKYWNYYSQSHKAILTGRGNLDILVYTNVNMNFKNTTKTSFNFLQEITPNQEFCMVSHQIWFPKLARYIQNTPLFLENQCFQTPKCKTHVACPSTKKRIIFHMSNHYCTYLKAIIYRFRLTYWTGHLMDGENRNDRRWVGGKTRINAA